MVTPVGEVVKSSRREWQPHLPGCGRASSSQSVNGLILLCHSGASTVVVCDVLCSTTTVPPGRL